MTSLSTEKAAYPPTAGLNRSEKTTYKQDRRSRTALIVTLLLGGASVGLYLLLFLHFDTLPELAAATRQGHKLYALIPLIIALVFSFIHGAFTGRFWDLLGLKAKK